MSLPIPGTVTLVDSDQHLSNVREEGEIVLVPQPSSSPDDPLKWSPRRKAFFMIFPLSATFILSSLSSVAGITIPGFAAIGIPADVVNAGSGYMFLLLGWGNLIMQPLALSYGRKPFLLMITLIPGVVIPVWAAYVKSNGVLYANRVVGGIFGAPVETLIQVMITDIFFVHDRAFWMSWYGFSLNGGSFLGPIASSFVMSNMGYRWVFFFHAIFSAAIFVAALIFMEEPGFPKRDKIVDGVPMKVQEISGEAAQNKIGEIAEPSEKDAKQAVNDMGQIEVVNSQSGEVGDAVPQNSSYWHRIRLWSKFAPFPSFYDFIRPLLILYHFPQILWAGFMLASSLSAFQILTGTITLVLESPPYYFSTNAVGLAYIGPAVAAIIASVYCGPLLDWFCLWKAKRRGGVHEAEDRIHLGLICVLLIPFGCILYGAGAANGVHWFGVVFGLSVVAAASTISSTIPFVYALDACENLGADAIVAIIIMQNTISFAFTYSIVPFVMSQGLQNTFIIVGFLLGVLFWITGIPMIKYGKRIRERTAAKYYKMCEK